MNALSLMKRKENYVCLLTIRNSCQKKKKRIQEQKNHRPGKNRGESRREWWGSCWWYIMGYQWTLVFRNKHQPWSSREEVCCVQLNQLWSIWKKKLILPLSHVFLSVKRLLILSIVCLCCVLAESINFPGVFSVYKYEHLTMKEREQDTAEISPRFTSLEDGPCLL